MTAGRFKTRFAPSPTGLLHLGNVRTALFNHLLARGRGGAFLLRIEDTDAVRGHDRYAAALQEDLAWLGLAWDEGPDVGGPNGPYAQSQRGELYERYTRVLEARELAYPCFCSEHELKMERKAQLAAGRPPRYSGRCRLLSPAEIEARRARALPATLRFHVADGRTVEFEDGVRGAQRFQTTDIGDFVIRRSDGTPAFFFCNAVDDALMGVTLVVRGDDHLANTPRQILLLEALGLPVPTYAHIPLVVGADGAPLSKRTGSRSLAELRAAGYLPAAIDNYLARLGHTYEEPGLLSHAQLAARFDLARVHHSPARYDETQLLHWQREAVKTLSADAFWRWAGGETQALVPASAHDAFIAAVRPNVLFPVDVARWARVVFGDELALSSGAREAIADAGRSFFEAALPALEEGRASFAAVSGALKIRTGRSGKTLFKPLRAALTGELDGPEMAHLLPLIGYERARARLVRALAHTR
ncbi:glutamyl-tRNA synthetase [Sulfurifustis variabilis]|uniref:Glutamate--tRNA ligase n=1 Tax=Sulfurifustis variabilis TaxID=1675686 RepID=A0A1B4V1F2_9GAMM|nr:glutamate--tRNA ligase [Sulfurifustis variabilis]BAU47310.1 glutamyl-tRNA synthetase [Sulfurifustis variabilis]